MLSSGADLVVACIACSLVVALMFTGDGSSESTSPVRLVLSSLASDERSLALSTQSLYAHNDPWKRYLAGERVCPGGERTDLPRARQLSIIACLVNFARERRGLHRLPLAPRLNVGSIRKADAIARCRNFAHNPCGGDWMRAVRSTGYPAAFGENLYLASGVWAAPRVAVDAWLNSPAHRRNLFAPEWREQGLALRVVEQLGERREAVVWVSVLGGGAT